jgi:hypothetical protein
MSNYGNKLVKSRKYSSYNSEWKEANPVSLKSHHIHLMLRTCSTPPCLNISFIYHRRCIISAPVSLVKQNASLSHNLTQPIKFAATVSLFENRTQTHGNLNELIFPHVTYRMLRYVSDMTSLMLDFDWNETSGHRVLYFYDTLLRFLPYTGLHKENPLH